VKKIGNCGRTDKYCDLDRSIIVPISGKRHTALKGAYMRKRDAQDEASGAVRSKEFKSVKVVYLPKNKEWIVAVRGRTGKSAFKAGK
jgi:hypothetical protein